jgi:hypothetical protein
MPQPSSLTPVSAFWPKHQLTEGKTTHWDAAAHEGRNDMIHRLERRRSRWKARLIWTFLVLGSAAGVVGYYYLHPEELPAWAARTEMGRDLQRITVYRWQDAAGRWHITDQPPADGAPYQTETYTPDTNVLPLPPKLRQ